MSSIYHTEPPTQGKVLLKTSLGDIDIELWSKEAPLACRNFVQLCLEGYYDNTLVNRVIKDFMVQMGDPTGTGAGGSSIWGRPFKDEIHGRIKFNHRGQVAMANENVPNSNQSQFFVTLGPCEWLNRKHTIFGKVTGNTIFNLLRFGEVEVSSSSGGVGAGGVGAGGAAGGAGWDNRPVDPIYIKSVEVLWNPFEDIVPRSLARRAPADGMDGDNDKERESEQQKKKKRERKVASDLRAVQTNALQQQQQQQAIAVGEQESGKEEAEQTGQTEHRATVSFDRQMKERVFESRRQSEEARSVRMLANNSDDSDDSDGNGATGRGGSRRHRGLTEKGVAHRGTVKEGLFEEGRETAAGGGLLDAQSIAQELEASRSSEVKRQLREKAAEFARLKEGLLRSKRAVNVITGPGAEKLREETAFKDLATPLEQRRQKYQKRKKEHGGRGEETLAKLMKFTAEIRAEKEKHAGKGQQEDLDGDFASSSGRRGSKEAGVVEGYHGQVLETSDPLSGGTEGKGDREGEKDDRERDDEDTRGWHVGKAKFKKHIDDAYRRQQITGDPAASGATGERVAAHGIGRRERVGADGRSFDDYVVVDPRKRS